MKTRVSDCVPFSYVHELVGGTVDSCFEYKEIGTMSGGFLFRVQGNTGTRNALRNLARIGCSEAAEEYGIAFLDVLKDLRHDGILLKDAASCVFLLM